MILDSNNRDPGNLVKCQRAKVYINGVLQTDTVLRCDDIAGVATVYCKTINGKYATTGFHSTKRILTKQIKADIVIELDDYRTPTP